MRLPRTNTCNIPICRVGEYIAGKQPELIAVLCPHLELTFAPGQPDQEEVLTPEQRYLEKLMKQVPRPGRGGVK